MLFKLLLSRPTSLQHAQKIFFWGYVNMMFNKPDDERVKKLGPDRTCAEWILRNGGSVVWSNGRKLADYNKLPSDDVAVPKIAEIDGTDSGISHYGFPHLFGCTELKKIVLHNASYIDDEALKGLHHAKQTLRYLQISECINVTDSGLKYLEILTKLETLILFNLKSVENIEKSKQFLKSKLNNCKIEGTPARAQAAE